MQLIFLLLILTLCAPLSLCQNESTRFLTIGDWGKGGVTGKYASRRLRSESYDSLETFIDQKQVGKDGKPLYQIDIAHSMGNYAATSNPKPSFVIALGDLHSYIHIQFIYLFILMH